MKTELKLSPVIIYTPKKNIEAYEQYFHLVFCHLNPLSLEDKGQFSKNEKPKRKNTATVLL
jgi:hypothetical protein